MDEPVAIRPSRITLASLLRGVPPRAPQPADSRPTGLGLWVARRTLWEIRAPALVVVVAALAVAMIGIAVVVGAGPVLTRVAHGLLALGIVLVAYVLVMPLAVGLIATAVAVTAPGRWLVLFLYDLDRRERTKPATDASRSLWSVAARMLWAGPTPGMRLLVATTVTFFAGVVASCFPDVRAGLASDAWPWQVLTTLLLALVPLLAARGVRLRHSTDRSIGGGTALYLVIFVACATTASAGLAGGNESPVLFFWAAGVWATGTYEVVLRSQSRVELMTVPSGYERRLVLVPAPTPAEVRQAFVQHYWPYDPHVSSEPTYETLDFWDAACPEFDWGRRSTGTERLARAILATFWGINDPHPRAVRRIMGRLLLGLEPDRSHVIEFDELVEAGLTSSADFEMGRFGGVPEGRASPV